MTTREIFQKKFCELMADSDMTQTDVAKHLGVTRSTVSAWITGRSYPRADVMQKISMMFNVRMSDLVTENKPSEDEILLRMFHSMDSVGRSKLLERAEELVLLYGKKSETVPDRQVL